MVLGNLQDAKNYYCLNPLFEKALDFLIENIDVAPGRYDIQGDDCYMMMVQADKRPKQDCRLEVHNTYIDIQVVIDGCETFGYKARLSCSELDGQFDTTKDIGFYSDQPTTYIDATQNDFVIFFPTDGHAPLVGQGAVRKAILKIRA